MAMRRQRSFRTGGPFGRAAVSLSLALTMACGGAQTSGGPRPGTPHQAELTLQARKHLRAQNLAEVLATAQKARQAGGRLEPALQVLEIQALWRLDRKDEALREERSLAALTSAEIASNQPGLAVEASLELARFHLGRKQARQAWAVLAPAVAQGCPSHPACRTTAATLLQLADKADEPAKLALPAAPRPGPHRPQRDRWLDGLARDLVRAGKTEAARALLAAALQQSPDEVPLWTALHDLLRRVPDARGLFLAELAAKKPTQATLARLAVAPGVASDHGTATQVALLAAVHPQATEQAWVVLARARMRSGDRSGLVGMAGSELNRFQTPESRLALARFLLGAQATDAAEGVLRPLRQSSPDEAVGLALEAELARQRGRLQDARALAQQATSSGQGDRGLAGLVLGQLWRTRLPADADRLLAAAANLPGPGQLAAARAVARSFLGAAPTPAAATAVARYARLLSQPSPSPETLLSDEVALPPAEERLALLRAMNAPSWAEIAQSTLRQLADAGLADAEMLRAQAALALKDDDPRTFLAAEARAAQAAREEGVELEDGRLLEQLTHPSSRASGTLLARWLTTAQVDPDLRPDLAARVGTFLLLNGHALLGRKWAEQALDHAGGEPTAQQAGVLAAYGAPDVALELARRHGKPDEAPDRDWARVEIAAWMALGKPQEADYRLRSWSRLTTSTPMRVAYIDLAGDMGLCGAVLDIAERLVAETQLNAYVNGLQRGLECARRDGPPGGPGTGGEIAQRLSALATQTSTDPTRWAEVARRLASHGFEMLALPLWQRAEEQRHVLPDDHYIHWSRALLAIGRDEDAVALLRRATTRASGNLRLGVRAVELLTEHGLLDEAERLAGELREDVPSIEILTRRLTLALRRGRLDAIADLAPTWARTGPADLQYKVVLITAERAGMLRPLLEAMNKVTDADREMERFRIRLAGLLGDRKAVVAGVRRLRTRGPVHTPEVAAALAAVGAWHEARELVEDMLASPEPSGDRGGLALQQALELRRDPTSAEEARQFARLYVGRSLQPGEAAAEAARVLLLGGHAREALAVAGASTDRHAEDTCQRAQIAERAGQRDEALRLWHQAMAGLQLEPRLRDLLRSSRGGSEDDRLHRALACIETGLMGAGEHERLAAWLEELVEQVPDSERLLFSLMLVYLRDGKPEQAVAALRRAAESLRDLSPRLQELVELTARQGGGPALLDWLADEGEALRTAPWLLRLAEEYLIGKGANDQRYATLRRALAELPAFLPALRMELALNRAAQGDGLAAAALLGPTALGVAREHREAAAQAVAAALAAGLAPATQGTERGSDLPPQLETWLKTARGADTRWMLAAELVWQGQPALARRLLAMDSTRPRPVQDTAEPMEYRIQAALGALDDAGLQQTALAWLTHRRGDPQLVAGRRPGEGPDIANPYPDLLMRRLAWAGRAPVAQAVAARLREQESGYDPAELGAPPPAQATLTERLRRMDPQAIEDLRATTPTDLPPELAATALTLAVAVDPVVALGWTARRSTADDEPWRAWHALLREAIALERLELARTALTRATAAGMPVGVRACPALWLERKGNLADCLRDRGLDGLTDPEVADVATAMSLGVDPSATEALLTSLPTRNLPERLINGWAERRWALSPAELQGTEKLIRRLIERIPAATRDDVIARLMDELAELGLADLGVQSCEAALKRSPHGWGQKNNLAYARYLAGEDPKALLTQVQPLLRESDGRSVAALLDTWAAILWELGQKDAAVPVQRLALAAVRRGAVQDPEPKKEAGLPVLRYAEFLHQRGQTAEARALVRLVLAEPVEGHTAARARRLLRAILAATHKIAKNDGLVLSSGPQARPFQGDSTRPGAKK